MKNYASSDNTYYSWRMRNDLELKNNLRGTSFKLESTESAKKQHHKSKVLPPNSKSTQKFHRSLYKAGG